MTTYSICNQKTGYDYGKYEADSMAGALDVLARKEGFRDFKHRAENVAGSDELVGTAVFLPEAPAASPFKTPLAVGTSLGTVPDQIFDATGQAVLILYAVDARGTVDEARSKAWNREGLIRADYVVKAVNEHEALVARVEQLEATIRRMRRADAVQGLRQMWSDKFDDLAFKQLTADLQPEQFTAKPIDEREHEQLVKRVAELQDMLVRALDNIASSKIAGIKDRAAIEQLIAKPVDRRKDE